MKNFGAIIFLGLFLLLFGCYSVEKNQENEFYPSSLCANKDYDANVTSINICTLDEEVVYSLNYSVVLMDAGVTYYDVNKQVSFSCVGFLKNPSDRLDERCYSVKCQDIILCR